jgi:hypothetical protein
MRLRRVALLVLLGALLVLVVAFTTLSIAYSPVYVVRWAVWQEADVGDKIRFPSSPIVAADEPFMFGSPSDPARSAASVRTAIERAGVVATPKPSSNRLARRPSLSSETTRSFMSSTSATSSETRSRRRSPSPSHTSRP